MAFENHEACLFQIPGTDSIAVDPSGSTFRPPIIEKIHAFHFNPHHGNYATLECEGTHKENSADLVRQGLMFPGRLWNLFICRYDAQPNFTAANGTQYRVRHTVHNLRARVTEFRELQTRITIDHESGHTEVKKVMRIVFEDVGPMEPAHISTLSTITATETTYVSSIATASPSTIATAWTPEISTLATLNQQAASITPRT